MPSPTTILIFFLSLIALFSIFQVTVMASQNETLCSNMEGVLSLGNLPLTLLSLQLYLRSLVCCTSPTYPSQPSPPLCKQKKPLQYT